MIIKRFDFGGYFRQRGITVPSSLVMYDKGTDVVTVDTRAIAARAYLLRRLLRVPRRKAAGAR